MVRRKSAKGVVDLFMLNALGEDISHKIFIEIEGYKSSLYESISIPCIQIKATGKPIIEFIKKSISYFTNKLNKLIVKYTQDNTQKTANSFTKTKHSLLLVLIVFFYISIYKIGSVWLTILNGFIRTGNVLYKNKKKVWSRRSSFESTGCIDLFQYLAGISVCEFIEGLSPSFSWKDNVEINNLINVKESLKYELKKSLSNIALIKICPTFQFKKYFRLLNTLYFAEFARGPPVHTCNKKLHIKCNVNLQNATSQKRIYVYSYSR